MKSCGAITSNETSSPVLSYCTTFFFLTKTCDVTIYKKTSSAENSHRHVQWNPALLTPAYNRHSYIMASFPTLKNLKFSLKITC